MTDTIYALFCKNHIDFINLNISRLVRPLELILLLCCKPLVKRNTMNDEWLDVSALACSCMRFLLLFSLKDFLFHNQIARFFKIWINLSCMEIHFMSIRTLTVFLDTLGHPPWWKCSMKLGLRMYVRLYITRYLRLGSLVFPSFCSKLEDHKVRKGMVFDFFWIFLPKFGQNGPNQDKN